MVVAYLRMAESVLVIGKILQLFRKSLTLGLEASSSACDKTAIERETSYKNNY